MPWPLPPAPSPPGAPPPQLRGAPPDALTRGGTPPGALALDAAPASAARPLHTQPPSECHGCSFLSSRCKGGGGPRWAGSSAARGQPAARTEEGVAPAKDSCAVVVMRHADSQQWPWLCDCSCVRTAFTAALAPGASRERLAVPGACFPGAFPCGAGAGQAGGGARRGSCCTLRGGDWIEEKKGPACLSWPLAPGAHGRVLRESGTHARFIRRRERKTVKCLSILRCYLC